LASDRGSGTAPANRINRTPRAKRTNFLACLLSNYFVRTLVFPNSEKDRMPETIISGPLCEFQLADHRWFNPMATLHFGSGHGPERQACTCSLINGRSKIAKLQPWAKYTSLMSDMWSFGSVIYIV
jgi:hypothetical protein